MFFAAALYPQLQYVATLFRLSLHLISQGRAFVDGLFFRHRLVVTPSMSLGLSAYIHGLARDCL